MVAILRIQEIFLQMFLRKGKKNPNSSNIIQDLTSRTVHIVHLTHNDFDAVGADAIHRLRFRDQGVYTIFSSVGKFPYYLEQISQVPGKGDVLSISDLSYRRGVESHIRRIRQKGWKIEWRDHHRWAAEDISMIRGAVDQLHIDTGRCACGICAGDLLPDDVIGEEIAMVVCDYDLWNHRDPRSAVLGLILQREKNREYVRDMMMLGVFEDGRIRKEYEEIKGEMNRVMKRSIRSATILGDKYRMAITPMYGYPSETAAYMRKELKTDIEVLVSGSGKFSIRSVQPISHLIANEFSGGGHPHAAGGFFPFTMTDKILLKIFKKNRYFRKISRVADSMS